MNRRYFPASLNVAGRPCLVIGNDREALEKRIRLADCGARARIVKPQAFRLSDLKGQFFVLLSSKDVSLIKKVAAACRKQKILLCAIDQPAYCDVINASAYERGPLKVAIGTDGVAPGLARKIRLGLEQSLKEVPLESFLKDLAALRKKLENEEPDASHRREKLLEAVEGFDFQARVTLPASWSPRQGKK